MKNKNRLLAYCSNNKVTATHFEADLSKVGISFTHMPCSDTMNKGNLAKELLKQDGDIFLMISDNFLKSSHCMVDALELLNKGLQQNRIQAIIVNAEETKTDGEQISKPTQFSRISDLINYMNFWQERYLKLRKRKDSIPKNKADEFDKELKRVRVISAEIGEFLRMLRDTDYWTIDKLREDHYALFFNKIGKQDLIIPFQKSMSEDESFTSQEEELTAVKKELKIASHGDEDGPSDPEELEAIRLTKLAEEENKTHEIFSAIFEKEDSKEETATSEEQESALTVENKKPGNINQWEDLMDQDSFEDELSKSMSNRFFEKIDQLIDKGEELTAAKELQQFLAVNTKSAEAHYRLSLLEASNEAYEAARKHCEQAIKLQPEEPVYHLTLGRLLFHHFANEPKKAERSFKKALQLNPANKEAHYEYAMLLHEVLGKQKKAISQLELTLAIAPDHPFANYDLALIYYGMKKRKKAAMYYEKSFSVNPELRTPDNDIAFWYETYLTSDQEEIPDEDAAPQKEDSNEDQIDEFSDPEEALLNKVILPPTIEEEDPLAKSEPIVESEEKTTKTKDDVVEEKESKVEIVEKVDDAVAKKQPLEVKTILITGATSGIGKATANLFAKKGHRLILTGRREGRLKALKKELVTNYKNDIHILAFDVRYQSVTKKSLNSLPKKWKDIDLLINNAGLAKGFDPIHEGDLKHWEIMLDTNVKGLLFITRMIAPGMVTRGSGQIINVCSSAGHEVYPSGAVYCATKHAVDALTKGMRLDLFKYGIRVGQVSPGHVEETEFAVVRFDGDKERAKIYEDFQPLKSSDVAEAIHFMASTPKHVTIHDVVMMGSQQASNVFIDRSGRDSNE